MKQQKLIIVAVVFVAILVGIYQHHRYQQLRQTCAASLVQMDYDSMHRAIYAFYKTSGYDFGPNFRGSYLSQTPDKVDCELRLEIPKLQGRDMQAFQNFLSATRPVCQFDRRFFPRWEIGSGEMNGDTYIYRWKCEL
jgi:hypothetical protein